jgi:mono/diheme cytochrome c family protein
MQYGSASQNSGREVRVNVAEATTDVRTPASKPQAPTPAVASNAEDIPAGQKLFNENCAHCHGPNAVKASSAATYGGCGSVTAKKCPRRSYSPHVRVSKGM